ncbi:hypothetical protein PENTCL1PPCAC_18887, partial [Pristionchus entomophagus]
LQTIMLSSLRRLTTATKPSSSTYDAIIVGGGHNGLTAAAYLAKAGKKVVVLERRHVLGGAAITEEIVPGFRFSRASYLLSLLRPVIIEELKLKEHGLRYHIRNPNSFTPLRNSKESLLLGLDMTKNQEEIGKFSKADAENYPKYEHAMGNIVNCLEKLMDISPLDVNHPSTIVRLKRVMELYRIVSPLGMKGSLDLYELMTAPISKVMDKWFESDILKATLGTDGVIGFGASPYDAGTGYVLLHHVLGGLDGQSGAWGYVYGGMGAVSQAIASAARAAGAELVTETHVDEILTDGDSVKGVRVGATEYHAPIVLAGTTPKVAFLDLMKKDALPAAFRQSIAAIDYTSPVTKINVAVKELPNFLCRPSTGSAPMPHHQTTVHMNCENMQVVDDAVKDFRAGMPSRRPIIEMTIPSVVDRSIVDGDGHVVLLFTQYTPFQRADGEWTEERKAEYAKTVFYQIDEYAPNFSSSIIGHEVLTPPDLEKTFGLTGGNIFHGSMSMDQLYWARPAPGHANFTTPVKGLYLCGSGAHPGGGVCGAPGRLASQVVLNQ